jgi:hypothetical protein
MWQKISIVLSVVLLIAAIDVLLSLRGEGPSHEGGGTLNINLGYPIFSKSAKSLALTRLADAESQHPKERFVRVRWVVSLFFGWDSENQDWLDYDNKNGGLEEAGNSPLLNEPSEEWGGVRADLLAGLAIHGFDSDFLTRSGCHCYESY